MNTILVTGGSGGLGRELVPQLVAAGYRVRVMSRRRAPAQLTAGMEWAQGDLTTGEGLAQAVAGVNQIIHAATLPQPFHRAAKAVDVVGTARLLRQAEAASVQQFFFISIVGIEHIPFFYYKHKLAAEKLVQHSSLNWSILRVVQFHSFVARLTSALARLPIMLVPTDFRFQTIETGEVAAAIVQGIVAGQNGRWPDLAGPRMMSWGEMARGWLAERGQQRRVWRLPVPGKIGDGFRAGYNCAPEKPAGYVSWEEWLRGQSNG